MAFELIAGLAGYFLGKNSSSPTTLASNLIENTVKQVLNMTTNIVNDATVQVDQSQNINIHDVGGSVIITNTTLKQGAYINLSAAFTAMVSQSAQQELALKMSQIAKSASSGFTAFTAAAQANNTINNYMEVTTNILTSVRNSCKALLDQSQKANIYNVAGNVFLDKVSFDQDAQSLMSCVADNVANNQALQKVAVDISQSASATTKGIDPTSMFYAIAIIIAMVVGVPIMGTIFMPEAKIKTIVGLVFLIVALITGGLGTALLIAYRAVGQKVTLKTLLYSQTIRSLCPQTAQYAQVESPAQTLTDAESACKGNPDCTAYDFIAYETTPDKSKISTTYQTPKTILYTQPVDCNSALDTPDKISLARIPIIKSGVGSPPTDNSTCDWWIDTDASEVYRYNTYSFTWDSIANFNDQFNTTGIKTCWKPAGNCPTKNIKDLIVAQVSSTDGTSFELFYYDSKGNVDNGSLSGLKMIDNTPPKPNASGIKTVTYNTPLLYAGLALGAMGVMCLILGLVFMFYQRTSPTPRISNTFVNSAPTTPPQRTGNKLAPGPKPL